MDRPELEAYYSVMSNAMAVAELVLTVLGVGRVAAPVAPVAVEAKLVTMYAPVRPVRIR